MAHALDARRGFVREHSAVLSLSVLAHVALFVVLALNLNLFPREEKRPTRLAIQATVVDTRAARARAAEVERREREQRLAEERMQAERERLEQQRIAEQKRVVEERREAERRQQEAEEARQAKVQQQRRQDAEKLEKAKAEQQRKAAEAKKVAAAKAEQQRKEADAKKLAAAEAERKAVAARRAAQTKADLERQLAEEEEFSAAAESGLLDEYAEIIRQKVERNWIRPASAREGINCRVLVKQIPGGEVVDVRIAECNGDEAVLRSIEAAVRRASPLPPPPDPALFDRSLTFDFRPRD